MLNWIRMLVYYIFEIKKVKKKRVVNQELNP